MQWSVHRYTGVYTDGAFDNFDPSFRFLDYYVRVRKFPRVRVQIKVRASSCGVATL